MSHPNWAVAERNVSQAVIDWPEHAEPYVTPQYGVVPQYGAPAQGYGSRRAPGTVIAAAVLAFVIGGLGVLVTVFCVLALALIGTFSAGRYGPFIAVLMAMIFVIVLLVAAQSALFIWGAVRALKGRKTMLMVVSIIQVVITVLALVANLVWGTEPAGSVVHALSHLVFLVPILILLALRPSSEFFRARRI